MKLEISLDPLLNADTINIPSLFFQPLLKMRSSRLPSKKGEKNINLDLSQNKDFLEVVIEDNGIGRKRAGELKDQKLHKKKSVGIKITKDRLKNFSGASQMIFTFGSSISMTPKTTYRNAGRSQNSTELNKIRYFF